MKRLYSQIEEVIDDSHSQRLISSFKKLLHLESPYSLVHQFLRKMIYLGILLCIFRLIAISVAIRISVQGDDYTRCITASSFHICSTDPQPGPDVPNPTVYSLDFAGNNCEAYEVVCYYRIVFPQGVKVAWYRKNRCFYADKNDPDDDFLGCVSDGLCLGKAKAENPYFRIQDTHANVRLAGSGSSINSKCPQPDGSYFSPNDNSLEEQNSVQKLKKQGKISMIEEGAQTIQPSDDSSPKSIASAYLTSASNDEESEIGIQQSDLGQTKVDNTDFQQFIDVTKRSENRPRKRFSA